MAKRVTGSPRRRPSAPLTLWGQALVFVLLGSGAFIGALVVVSSRVVSDSRERLLDERMALAKSVAQLLEHQLQTDIVRLVKTAELLITDQSAQDNALSPTVLATAVRLGSMRDGAFVLDRDRRPLVGAFDPAAAVWDIEGIDGLLDRVARTKRAVLSPLRAVRGRPVLAVVAPTRGRRRELTGFAVGLLQPVESDLLRTLREESPAVAADVAVLDANGVHVAATEPSHLMEHTIRDGALARAIRERRAFRGLHDCHAEQSPPGQREVLAFAPMRTLNLSVIVIQPEDTALAPAFELRSRLLGYAAPLVVLFIAFSLLSVHSVVRPVRSLTLAVRRARSDRRPLDIAPYGRDEVGELASSMQAWHRAMLDSLATAEDHRAALDRESRALRRYLEALHAVSEASTSDPSVEPMLRSALGGALGFLEARRGVIALDRGGKLSVVVQDLTVEQGAALVEAARVADRPCGELIDLSAVNSAVAAESARQFCHDSAPGVRIGLIVVDGRDPDPEISLWLSNLLQHASMCASHQALRDADRERRQQQEHYLHRVLQAQEDERSRVARDLHDTVAQDLAALRLDAERLAARAADPAMQTQLRELEARSQEMLITVRRILLDLRLSILEGEGLLAAIRYLLERAHAQGGLHTHLFVDGDEQSEIGYASAIALFRVAQEALLNVVQHANAEHVLATIRIGEHTVDLTIEDDGQGFDGTSASDARVACARAGGGLGILGMQERASVVGGSFRIESSPGEGTTVHVSVPTATPADAPERAEPVRVES